MIWLATAQWPLWGVSWRSAPSHCGKIAARQRTDVEGQQLPSSSPEGGRGGDSQFVDYECLLWDCNCINMLGGVRKHRGSMHNPAIRLLPRAGHLAYRLSPYQAVQE
jgi:hypothetical protein